MKRPNKKGQSTVEYAVIVALVIAVAIGAFRFLGSSVNSKVSALAQEIR